MSSSYIDSVAHAAAGSFGGIIAMLALYPLENVRTRLQVQKDIINRNYQSRNNRPDHGSSDTQISDDCESSSSENELHYKGTIDCIIKVFQAEGPSAFYSGCTSALIGVSVSYAAYFFFYSTLKKIVLDKELFKKAAQVTSNIQSPKTRISMTPLENIVVASLAGILNVFLTLPIWTLNIRMALTHKSDKSNQLTIMQTIKQMYRTEGWHSFYKGLFASLILISNPAIQFVMYEQLVKIIMKRTVHSRQRSALTSTVTLANTLPQTTTAVKLSSLQYFLIGAISKAIATIGTYPYQTVKSRMQADKSLKPRSFYQMSRQQYCDEGIQSFFQGMNAKLLSTVLNSAFMFVVYEKLVTFFLKLLNHRHQKMLS